MTAYIAMIQAGQAADQHRQQLAEGLATIAADVLGTDKEDTRVLWKAFPSGWAWTEGKPSGSSMVLCNVPEHLAQDTRERLMHRINTLWVEHTGVDPNEVAITAHPLHFSSP